MTIAETMMCGVIIESESDPEGLEGFKIVFDCGDADHSDGLNGTRE